MASKENERTRIQLPYPPTVNTYWRHVGHKVLVSAKGRAYRVDVQAAALRNGLRRMAGELSVSVDVYPPDLRRRDLDNLLKSLLDSLQHAGAYDDDSQIAKLTVERMGVIPQGMVVVSIEPRAS
jgi:crossover junction endodeoxyribonuclease RusA